MDLSTTSGAAFGAKYNEGLVHQIVTAYQAAARSGNASQKTRSEVSGGGAKPWRQKGTGRARAGTSRSPIWTGGGVTFAAKPRDYTQKVNKKMYRAAMRSILSQAVADGRLKVVDDLEVAAPKTRLMREKLADHGVSKALLLVDDGSDNAFLAVRNIPNVEMLDAEIVDPVSLVRYPTILATPSALQQLEKRFA